MAMDVKKKLVELLTDLYGCDPAYYDVDAQAIAQHLIDNGVTVQEWISVEDRLPEEDGSYLVTTNSFGDRQSGEVLPCRTRRNN